MTTAHLNASHADQIIYDTENKFFSDKFIHTHTHQSLFCFYCCQRKMFYCFLKQIQEQWDCQKLFCSFRLQSCKTFHTNKMIESTLLHLATTNFWSFKKRSPTLNTVHHVNSHHALNNSSLSSYPITLDWVTLTVTPFCTTEDFI